MRDQNQSANAPVKMTVTALIGISAAIPIPVGDGTRDRHVRLCSASVIRTPATAPAANDILIHVRRAAASALSAAGPVSSRVISRANPTQRCDVGLRSW